MAVFSILWARIVCVVDTEFLCAPTRSHYRPSPSAGMDGKASPRQILQNIESARETSYVSSIFIILNSM